MDRRGGGGSIETYMGRQQDGEVHTKEVCVHM